VPSLQNITVNSGSVTLPFLTQKRTGTIQGDKGVQLDDYLSHKVTVSADTASGSQQAGFALPPEQTDPPAGGG
jgi:hypothetical protein